MLKTVTRVFVRVGDRWMPDPLVIAIFLTFVCLAAAFAFTDFAFTDAIDTWGVSFWNLLAFTMQMILILAWATSLPIQNPRSWCWQILQGE